MKRNIVKYNGLKYKVEDRVTSATYRVENCDEQGNPSVGFQVTKYINDSDLAKMERKLRAKNKSVTMTFAHEITTLFREVVNKGDSNKDVKIVQVQRKFKNGSWNSVNPMQEEADLEGEKEWTNTQKVIATAVAIAVIGGIYWAFRGILW